MDIKNSFIIKIIFIFSIYSWLGWNSYQLCKLYSPILFSNKKKRIKINLHFMISSAPRLIQDHEWFCSAFYRQKLHVFSDVFTLWYHSEYARIILSCYLIQNESSDLEQNMQVCIILIQICCNGIIFNFLLLQTCFIMFQV